MTGGATTSVVCSTYNIQPTSAPWRALLALTQDQPGVSVRLYVDTQSADGRIAQRGPSVWRPPGAVGVGAGMRRGSTLSTREMARLLTAGAVLRTRRPDEGKRPVTSRAKLISVDRRFLLVGSANFSYSAGERSVEFGLPVDGGAPAASVEKQVRELESSVYEWVRV